MQKTYSGSCHCGNVRFECDLDLSQGTSKCNCSICTKSRFWKTIIMGDAFRLLEGEESLTDYQFGGNSIHHLFCNCCGIKPFGRGYHEDLGEEFYAVNIACLDSASAAEKANAPVSFEDGANDNPESPPSEIRHL